MAGIKGKSGGRRSGAGRKKEPSTQLKDAIGEVNLPKIVKNLERWSEGKEVVCPKCAERTGVYVPDTVALQSAIELLNRRLGKVPQQVQVDITEKVQFTADQIDTILNRLLASPEGIEFLRLHMRALLPEAVDAEYKEVV